MISSPSDDRAHLRLWELLPSLLNGAASASERQELEHHLSSCRSCRAELAFQQRLREAMKASIGPVGPDVDAGLERLLKGIEARPRPRARRMPPYRRVSALGVTVAALLVLSAGGAAWLRSLLGGADRVAVYRRVPPLTRFLGKARARRPTIRLVADASLPMGRLDTQLAALGLQIVSGPRAGGTFLLAQAPGGSKADRDKQVATLRAVSGVHVVEAIAPSDP